MVVVLPPAPYRADLVKSVVAEGEDAFSACLAAFKFRVESPMDRRCALCAVLAGRLLIRAQAQPTWRRESESDVLSVVFNVKMPIFAGNTS
jgi:hypothetical protein